MNRESLKSLGVLVLVVIFLFSVGWRAEAKRVASSEVGLGRGQPWYGGKPSLPVRIESDIEGEIPAGEWVPLQIFIFTDLPCSTVVSKLRAVDAIEVDSVDVSQACRVDAPVLHEAMVRVADQGSGMIAVDLEVLTEGGVKLVTRAIPFSAAPSIPSGN